MYKKDKATLLAILEAIEKILEFTQSINSADDYYHNRMIFDATLMNFITIGEMVDRLSDEIKDKYPAVDWQKIKDFRNIVAHDYMGIDAEEVWQIIRADIPRLLTVIQNMSNSLEKNNQ